MVVKLLKLNPWVIELLYTSAVQYQITILIQTSNNYLYTQKRSIDEIKEFFSQMNKMNNIGTCIHFFCQFGINSI